MNIIFFIVKSVLHKYTSDGLVIKTLLHYVTKIRMERLPVNRKLEK